MVTNDLLEIGHATSRLADDVEELVLIHAIVSVCVGKNEQNSGHRHEERDIVEVRLTNAEARTVILCSCGGIKGATGGRCVIVDRGEAITNVDVANDFIVVRNLVDVAEDPVAFEGELSDTSDRAPLSHVSHRVLIGPERDSELPFFPRFATEEGGLVQVDPVSPVAGGNGSPAAVPAQLSLEFVEARHIVSKINVVWAVEGRCAGLRKDIRVWNTSAVVAEVLAHVIDVFLAHVAVSEMAILRNEGVGGVSLDKQNISDWRVNSIDVVATVLTLWNWFDDNIATSIASALDLTAEVSDDSPLADESGFCAHQIHVLIDECLGRQVPISLNFIARVTDHVCRGGTHLVIVADDGSILDVSHRGILRSNSSNVILDKRLGSDSVGCQLT